ncbi:MAG: Arc family DNA-binding protein [Candidatus Omnitrophica bacterium]|nr:Arc family DNA-binding protein [Candidatus Omnitrophota bacterium]MDE2009667.1 Arc family DNA-binding protein [Candidatus Omnitrophota bacterium]MDE2214405.1 Arc family DNA-binding protein [Candidatus Omnitrophota bacterium]MDE2231545.1 Arc family DNA-binding protein [Candidatus Omnitrophota bacterium]
MSSITIKNIPTRLHETLKRRAAMTHRSLNNEIIASLEVAAGLAPMDTNQMALDATLMHKAFRGEADPGDIDRFKKEGRE